MIVLTPEVNFPLSSEMTATIDDQNRLIRKLKLKISKLENNLTDARFETVMKVL